MSRSWAQGSSSAWRKTRQRVLLRDQHQCQLRLEGCARTASCVHHTQGIKMTGMYDEKYLVASCANCNTAIGEPEHDPKPKPKTKW